LRPRITLAAGTDNTRAGSLFAKAHAICFIATSVPTTVESAPAFESVESAAAAEGG
jgi:organic hydroperoxide reductase OsmC/OhrA